MDERSLLLLIFFCSFCVLAFLYDAYEKRKPDKCSKGGYHKWEIIRSKNCGLTTEHHAKCLKCGADERIHCVDSSWNDLCS